MIHIEYIRDISDKDAFNTNNHDKDPDDLEVAHKDYLTEVSKTQLSNYLHLINYPVEWTYTFTSSESLELIKICQVGVQVLRRPKIFDDEIDEIEKRLQQNWVEGEWFMRLDESSPKDASIRLPYRSASKVVDAIITSMRALRAIKHNIVLNKPTILYFVKYNPVIKKERELRCFVRNKKLTAISQYDCYNCSFFSNMEEPELKIIAQNINTMVSNIVDKICQKIETNDFVIDLYLNNFSVLEIVELNSFGYWLASGSALFHWLKDKNKLYNESDNVYFRVLSKSENI